MADPVDVPQASAPSAQPRHFGPSQPCGRRASAAAPREKGLPRLGTGQAPGGAAFLEKMGSPILGFYKPM